MAIFLSLRIISNNIYVGVSQTEITLSILAQQKNGMRKILDSKKMVLFFQHLFFGIDQAISG